MPDLPWWAWGQAFLMLAPIVAVMLWLDRRQRRKSRELWKKAEAAAAAFNAWIDRTTACPTCGGSGRVGTSEPGRAEATRGG